MVTKPILDTICKLDTHWFFFCCGALVNVPSSLKRVESFANEYAFFFLFLVCLTRVNRQKPTNLFAFDAPAFHPIYATTFLLNFFQCIIIEGRTFDSAIGQLLNTSALSRHSGIVRFWTSNSVVKKCTLRWTHSRIQPWGKPVPYQCPSCHCIQAWNQKHQGASSELGRNEMVHCSYQTVDGRRCPKHLTFDKPSTLYKPLKLLEGAWVAFGLKKSDFL